jgi:hypothetical protein
MRTKARGIGTLVIVAIIAIIIVVAVAIYIFWPKEETTCTLSTSVSPSGCGLVSPASGTYDKGDSVTLTATATSGYKFDHWGEEASGSTNPITVTMDSDKSIVAYFTASPPEEEVTYTLSISVSPPRCGSVSPDLGTCDAGESVTLTATPSSGYRFDHWGGSVSGSVNPVTVTMDSDKSIIAYFTIEDGPITVEGIQLQLGSATKQATYETSEKTYEPVSAYDEILVVKVELLSAEIEQVIDWSDKDQVNDWKRTLGDQLVDWEVTVTDENGRVEEPIGYMSITYPDISPQGTWTTPGEVTWLFVVKKTSNSFTLNLPENKTIKLDLLS